jgi:hypothetical protein
MLNRIANAALALMVVFGITVPTAQSFADPFTDSIAKAIEDGTIKLGFRYRYEFVDQDSFDDDAHANTLRTRLTFAPQVTDDWGFLLEFDDVRRIGSASFNDTRNGKTDRPTVADPKGTDLNQMAIRYAGWENATILLGRQRINRTNQRFIGGVGWRQNEQTYDSLSLGYQFNSKLNGYYAYVAQVNRIFGRSGLHDYQASQSHRLRLPDGLRGCGRAIQLYARRPADWQSRYSAGPEAGLYGRVGVPGGLCG